MESNNRSEKSLEDEFISNPVLSENSSLPIDILTFDYSFGYDCKRYYNLTVADENTLIFVSGNLIHFFNVKTKTFVFRRSAFGEGIGYITKNPAPEFSHLAVGENGNEPLIILYHWPSLKVVKVLKKAAEKCFTYLVYSPNGKLLLSHSGAPDFVLNVFDWKTASVLFRTKSNEYNKVHRIIFSNFESENFVSCGEEHIKFWKMEKTFTSLKLISQMGKFGTTTNSTILGILSMPDGKVISGTEWGNILIWDDSLIKIEVSRRLARNCHDAPITQFIYFDRELWSIGMDGKIRIWYYKRIEFADNHQFALEPMFEFCFPGIMFMYIIKHSLDDNDTNYFVQDGNGGLWTIDLNIETYLKNNKPIHLFKCHAGPIVDMAACSWAPFLVSFGMDGALHLYDYVNPRLLFRHQYAAKGSAMIWLPLNIQESGDLLIMGFDDGNLRVVVLNIDEDKKDVKVTTIQIIKPHSQPITTITANKNGTLLVSGAKDATVFIFKMENNSNKYKSLIPIGYLSLLNIVTCLSWTNKQETELLIGCRGNHFIKVNLPTEQQSYTTTSYLLQLEYLKQQFRTNTTAELISQTVSDRSIIWMEHKEDDTIWISLSGVDGYIYEYCIDEHEGIPLLNKNITHDNDKEISYSIYNYDKSIIIFAMKHGAIRVTKVNPTNKNDLSDFWELSMHDNLNGFISKLCFSYDENYIFSCGHDGNIFSYKLNPQFCKRKEDVSERTLITSSLIEVQDFNSHSCLSLEELKVKEESDRKLQIIVDNRRNLTDKLDGLRQRFLVLMERNARLPYSQRIPRNAFEIDARITANLESIHGSEEDLIRQQLAFHVERSRMAMVKLKQYFTDLIDLFPIQIKGIHAQVTVCSIHQRRLTDEFHQMLDTVNKKVSHSDSIAKWEELVKIVRKPECFKTKIRKLEKSGNNFDAFLTEISSLTMDIKLEPRITQRLEKYKMNKQKLVQRQKEWETFKALKPYGGKNLEDQLTLKQAIESIGDYKLKSDEVYKVPKHLWQTVATKYRELLLTRLKQYDLCHNFNLKVLKLRHIRIKVDHSLGDLIELLKKLQEEIDDKYRKEVPYVSKLTKDDFPENNLIVKIRLRKQENEQEDKEIVQKPKKNLLEKEILLGNIIEKDEEQESLWEMEARIFRHSRKLFKQEALLKAIYEVIEGYDNQVKQLNDEKIQIICEDDFLSLHLLTQYKELLILKKYEEREERIREDIHNKIEMLFSLKQIVEECDNKILHYSQEIEDLLSKENGIYQQFLKSTVNNNNYPLLTQIFSEDCDESKYDDPSILCPEICEVTLLKTILQLRLERCNIKSKRQNLQQDVFKLEQETKGNYKKIQYIFNHLKIKENNLQSIQKEKQGELNQVTCTIVLKLHQLQHIKSENTINKIDETLVFSASKLSRLYKRVGQLHNETLLQKSKHNSRDSVLHLRRMKTDCRVMENQIAELEEGIKKKMKLKFGKMVDIQKIKEEQLKQMIWKLRFSQITIKTLYQKQIDTLQKKYKEKQNELKQAINENTFRITLLTTIQNKKIKLLKTYVNQERKEKHLDYVINVTKGSKDEIRHLLEIIDEQNKELQKLREEIQQLNCKGFPAPQEQTIADEILMLTKDQVENEHLNEWQHWESNLKEETSLAEVAQPISEIITTQVLQIPLTSTNEKEYVLKQQILNMVESLTVISSKLIFHEGLIDEVISNLSNQVQVNEIIDQLSTLLEKEITIEENFIIEATAQEIFLFLSNDDDKDESWCLEDKFQRIEKVTDLLDESSSDS